MLKILANIWANDRINNVTERSIKYDELNLKKTKRSSNYSVKCLKPWWNFD